MRLSEQVLLNLGAKQTTPGYWSLCGKTFGFLIYHKDGKWYLNSEGEVTTVVDLIEKALLAGARRIYASYNRPMDV